MGIYKHPNSPYWYYTFTVDGRRVTASTRTTNKTLATEIYATRRADCLRKAHDIRTTRRVPFEERAKVYLEWSRANKDGDPYMGITKAFKSTCVRAGIKVSTPHVMRHTFASHLTMLGVDPYTIMELGGWKSLEMVMRYSHLAPDHKQMAINKLGDMLKSRLNSTENDRDNVNTHSELIEYAPSCS